MCMKIRIITIQLKVVNNKPNPKGMKVLNLKHTEEPKGPTLPRVGTAQTGLQVPSLSSAGPGDSEHQT